MFALMIVTPDRVDLGRVRHGVVDQLDTERDGVFDDDGEFRRFRLLTAAAFFA
jgi:hypothetical protein